MILRKVFGLILCALCLVGTAIQLPQAQAAERDGFTYEVHDGKATITGCTVKNSYFLDIPSTIDGYPVVSIAPSAFQERTDLVDVTIPEGVQTIGAFAFYECTNLRDLYLPNSLVSIGEKAFFYCKSLETLDFGNHLKTIGDGAFSYCYKLPFYLEIPNGVESIGMGAFYYCASLETVLLPKSLKDLGSKSFAMCGSLDYIYIPDGVERVGAQVLYQSACYYYTSNWYGDAFYIGSYLMEAKKSISGSYTTLKGITNIADGAFENCNELTEVILPEGLRIIGANAFDDCDKLQRMVIPAGVTTIGDKAFYECKALTQIQVPDTVEKLGQDVFTKTGYYSNPENWEEDAFYVGSHLVRCNPSITGVFSVRPGTKNIVNGALKDLTKLTELILPSSLVTIGDEAFYNCKAMKTVHLGLSVSKIGTGAFGQCASLESITVDSANKTFRSQNNCLIRTQDKQLVLGCKASRIPADGSVTSIDAFAFEGCAGLTRITIPDTVLTIGEGAFRDCNDLTEVHLGNGVQVVGKRAFEECDVLSVIDLGQSVHTIDDFGFAYNHGLTRVEFPASLRYLGEEAFSNGTGLVSLEFREGLVSIGVNCFYMCESLTNLHLPDSLEEILDGAFYSCEKIASIHFGKELRTIGSSAFDGCKALQTLVIPGKVKTIGNAAFYECTSLRQVDLGNVEKIGYGAFESCKSLTQVHIPTSVREMGKSVFAYCPAIESLTVSQQNRYYHSRDNCIIHTKEKYLAFGCKNSIIPADGSVTVLDGYAFAGCRGLKHIVVPDQVTRICAYTFYDCGGLEFMQLPFVGGEREYDNYLGYIFGGGPSQNDLYVPASLKRVVITGGTKVGESGFSKCAGLQEVVLPESVTTIGYGAFEKCAQLQRVIVPGNLEKIKDKNILGGSPYAKLFISAGQENTQHLFQSYGIPHRVGGLITFLDENGQRMDAVWYPLGGQIQAPAIPQKPTEDALFWDPVPGVCSGNQTIRLRGANQDSLEDFGGDFTGDREVNNLDVEYLLWHTLFPGSYPIHSNADFNRDGEANNLDVEYLLWHTLFPENYPINK